MSAAIIRTSYTFNPALFAGPHQARVLDLAISSP
jgi:hypothetical protein